MANRFYVGGVGNWNTTNSWSTTSGGGSGASVPTSTDNAIFDTNSGAFQCSIDTNASCNNLDLSAVTNSSAFLVLFSNSATSINVNGSLLLAALGVGNNIIRGGSSFGTINLVGSGNITMASTNNAIPSNVNISGTYSLTDDNFSGVNITLTISGGTFTTNNHAITAAGFKVTNSPTCNLGTSTITVGQQGTIITFSATATMNSTNASFLHRSAAGGQVSDTSFPAIIDLNGATISELSISYLAGFDDSYVSNKYIRFKTSGTITQLDVPQGVFMKGVAGITLTITNCNIVGTASLPCSLISETGGSTFNVCLTNQNIKYLTVTKDVVWSCTAAIDIGGICSGGSCGNITFPPDVSPTAQAAALLLML